MSINRDALSALAIRAETERIDEAESILELPRDAWPDDDEIDSHHEAWIRLWCEGTEAYCNEMSRAIIRASEDQATRLLKATHRTPWGLT